MDPPAEGKGGWSPGDGGSSLPAMVGGMEWVGLGGVGGVYNLVNWSQRMHCENTPQPSESTSRSVDPRVLDVQVLAEVLQKHTRAECLIFW